MTRKPQKVDRHGFGWASVGFVLAVCILTGIGAGAILWRGDNHGQQQAVDTTRQVLLVSSGYDAAGLLLIAADNLAEERGLTYSTLKSSGHISEESRNHIGQAREKADQAFAEALDLIGNRLEFDRNSSFMQKISIGLKGHEQLRAEIDAWARSEEPMDRTTRATRWFRESSRQMASVEQLLELVHAKISGVGVDIDASVALRLQRLAMILVDYVGRQRGVMSGAIAENSTLDAQFSGWVLPAYRGRISGIWTSIKAAANANALSPEIASLIAKVDRDYFDGMEKLHSAIEKASRAGEPYPVTAEQWFARSSEVIDSIVGLGREAGQFAKARFEKSRQAV